MVAFAELDSRRALRELRFIDRAESKRLAERVVGGASREMDPLPLDLAVWPPPGIVCAANLPAHDIVCFRDFARRRPSELTEQVSRLASGRNAYGVFMHSANDWAAFAVWSGGNLLRSLSLSPSSGVIEDLGERLPFESPFWRGERPVRSAANYALPFHPVDLGNEALREFFGFILEGREDDFCIDPEEIEIPAFHAASEA
ncbi:DUF6928 family protein [Kribbella turkmenica]